MDQVHDTNGQDLYRIVKLYDPPQFVKSASDNELCGDVMPSHVYADPRRKLFPCHTPAATWTSWAFFLEKQGNFSPEDARSVRERLERFTTIHGIEDHIARLREKFAWMQKHSTEDLSDDDFALVIPVEREIRRMYPLRNEQEIKAAAEYLFQFRNRIPYPQRQQMASRILDKAEKKAVFHLPQREMLEQTAGRGFCLASECASLLRNRVRAVDGPGKKSLLQHELLKLAREVEANPSITRNPNFLYKIACAVDLFDWSFGLNQQYGPSFPPVEDVLFSLSTQKMAKVLSEHVETVNGSVYRLSDLEKIRLRDVEDALGSDIADAMSGDGLTVDIQKAAEVLPTLPRGDAEIFDSIAESCGVFPAGKEAKAQAIDISFKNLKKLAALRRRPGS